MDTERAIEFIIEQQAKFSADIDILKGTVAGTSQNLVQLAQIVSSLANTVGKLEAEAEINRIEIREAIEILITSDENMRSFAMDMARIIKQHEARILQLEKSE